MVKIMHPLLLASGSKSFLPVTLAVIAVIFIIFFLLKNLRRGLSDVYRYYQTDDVKNWWVNKLYDNIILVCLTLIIFFPPLAFGGEYLWGRLILESIILIAFYVYMLKAIRSGVIKYRRNVLNVMFFLFIFYLIFQILFRKSLVPYDTFLSLKTAVLYFALFTVIANHVKHRDEIDDIIFKIMVAGTIISCVGILQVWTRADKIYWFVQPNFPTFFGPFQYWNQFACYISMAILLTLGSLCYDTVKGEEIPPNLPFQQLVSNVFNSIMREKVFPKFVCFGIMFAALLLTKSRAGMFCLFAAFLIFFSSIFRYRHSKKIALTLLMGILAAALTLGFISMGLMFMGVNVDLGIGGVLKELGTVFSSDEYIFRTKLYTMDGPEILKDYPFFGIGLGNIRNILPIYLSSVPVHGWGMKAGMLQIAVVSEQLFNDILQLLVEVGLVGFIILLIPFAFFMVKLFKKIDESESDYTHLIGMGCLSALLFLGLHSTIDYDMSLNAISSLFIIVISISLLVINLRPAEQGSEIGIESRKVVILKSGISRIIFYFFITIAAACFAFIILRPFIVENLLKRLSSSYFDKAVMLDPKNDELFYKYHKFIIGEYKKKYISKEEAIAAADIMIDKAIELNPYKTSYVTAKADLLLLKKDYDGASSFYKKASLMEPNNAFIQMGYAIVLFWQALHEKYIMEKREVLLKTGQIYYNKARLLSKGLVTIQAVVKDDRARSYLLRNLEKEGINIQ